MLYIHYIEYSIAFLEAACYCFFWHFVWLLLINELTASAA